ncbi:MAG: bifunctional serine/threonine-protein kinase/formylglycine-generating enzyme family protein [Myxococcota bacterium]|nr:bifunctional serine/threonine-protein kinase/formylglycine-generating enzyme family protein [Myxococcota bacterium]
MGFEPGTILGNYQVETTLGEGGMASVYRVRHQILGSLHAVKVLHPHLASREDVRLRFLEEGKIQAQYRHPNILQVSDLINEQGCAGLVMELLEGEDLSDYLTREGVVPVTAAIDWCLQALDALALVHADAVVHRDLKPSNLYLVRDVRGRIQIKLMDFGIAKVRDRQLTNHDGGMMGTLCYMSPEQLEQPAAVDQQTDVFAMGAILYEMVCGRSPFDGESDFQIMRRISEGQYTAPGSDIPPTVAAAVVTALKVNPSERFASATDFADALHEASRTERYRRALRLLAAVESAGLPHRWWIPDSPDDGWLRGMEGRLQDWLQKHAPPPPSRPEGGQRIALPGGVPLELISLPAGSFVRGSAPGEPDRHADEGPPHTVHLSAFRMMSTPVTQGQWLALSDTNPSGFTDDTSRPVEQVSWMTAIRFCNRLSAAFELEAAYQIDGEDVRWDRTKHGFRLPTEAEWEYAARAGQTTPYGCAEEALLRSCWFADNAEEKTSPVAQKAANPWGLYDLTGNVYEWCWDRLGPYPDGEITAPTGPELGEYRVLRGGSFRSTASDLRVAFRNGRQPAFSHCSVGFRCVIGALNADD